MARTVRFVADRGYFKSTVTAQLRPDPGTVPVVPRRRQAVYDMYPSTARSKLGSS